MIQTVELLDPTMDRHSSLKLPDQICFYPFSMLNMDFFLFSFNHVLASNLENVIKDSKIK